MYWEVKVCFGKCCTFSYSLSFCCYPAHELTKPYLSCYALGTALSCSKPCFLSCKVQSVQQDYGHLPSLLSGNTAWICWKISTVVETHGRLCCWDYRPCFREQPCHAHTQGFKPPLFSQSVGSTVGCCRKHDFVICNLLIPSVTGQHLPPCQHHQSLLN